MSQIVPDDYFLSDDDLLTFEGFLKYQGVDPNSMTADELKMWRQIFDEASQRRLD